MLAERPGRPRPVPHGRGELLALELTVPPAAGTTPAARFPRNGRWTWPDRGLLAEE